MLNSLLGTSHEPNQKSRFLDQPHLSSSSQLNQNRNNGGVNLNVNNNSLMNGNALNDTNLNDSLLNNQLHNQHSNGANVNGNNNNPESNHMFEKILSEVIHVSAYDQRGTAIGYHSNDLMTNMHPVQDMPFKLKGLLEPQFNQQQQLTLPDGVPAPLTVLAAQPPFLNDIHLINSIAVEASNCINNFSLNVPDNVAFDFKPVV